MTLTQRADKLGTVMQLVLEVMADPDLSPPARRSLNHLEEIVQLVHDRFRQAAAVGTDERSAVMT